jgi:hypothetical protein
MNLTTLNQAIIVDTLTQLSDEYDTLMGWGWALLAEGEKIYMVNPDSPCLGQIDATLTRYEERIAVLAREIAEWANLLVVATL